MFGATSPLPLRALASILTALLVAALFLPVPAGAYPDPPPPATDGGHGVFLPAPNPVSYCDSADFFGPWAKNEAHAADNNLDVEPLIDQDADGDFNNDTGTQDIVSDVSSTGPGGTGILATYTATPGLEPEVSAATEEDGVKHMTGDSGTITLSEPLFYSQWVFVDVDLSREGFEVAPDWQGGTGEIAIVGGNRSFAFAPGDIGFAADGPGSSATLADFNDTDARKQRGDQIASRVQVDFLGAISGFSVNKTGKGGAGFVGGSGCPALGVSKRASEPAWDSKAGTFTVDYTIEVRNNLPSTATLEALIDAAMATAPSSFLSGSPEGLTVDGLSLIDALDSTGFSSVDVTDLAATGPLVVNAGYDGAAIRDLLLASSTLPAETTETVSYTVTYTPDLDATAWSDCSHEIENQAELAGAVGDVAVADTSDDGADPAPAAINDAGGSDDATQVSFGLDCEIGLSKQIVSVAETAAGEYTIIYDLVAENTGTAPITNPLIEDDLASAFGGSLTSSTITADTCTGATLTSGQTCAQTIEVVVTPTTDYGPYENSATVTGEGPGGVSYSDVSHDGPDPDPEGDGTGDNLEPTTIGLPGIELIKKTTSTPAAVGDPIEYTFEITNIGAAPLTEVSVSDPLLGGVVCDSGTNPALATMAPGAIETCSATHTVIQADIDAGGVINSATVTAVGPDKLNVEDISDSGSLTPSGNDGSGVDDPTFVPLSPDASIALSKSADVTEVTEVGQTITYFFDVTNAGNVELNEVWVSDAKCAGSWALVSESITSDFVLQVGETWRVSCLSAPVTQAEIDAGRVDNTATTGAKWGKARTPLTPVSADHTIPAIQDPAFSVIKSADLASVAAAGQTIEYSFEVTNNGNVTLHDLAVDDAKCSTTPALDSETEIADALLQVGETMTFSCTSIAVTQAEIDAGQVDNSVSVMANGPLGDALAPATDDHSVPAVQDPAFSLVKSTTTTAATAAGQTIDYTFVVTNDGNMTLDNVVVTDAKCASGPTITSETVIADAKLQVGETITWTCTAIPVTQSEIDSGAVVNTAQLEGETLSGTALKPQTAQVVVPVAGIADWGIVKTSADTPAAVGDTIDYSFALVNTGNFTISAVSVADAKCSAAPVLDSESVATNSALDVGETQIWTCTSIPVTQAEFDDGEVHNSVSATGTPALGELEPIGDDHTIPIDQHPSWQMVKATVSTPTMAGEVIEYTFTVVNTGNVTISDVAVSDAKCSASPSLDSETLTANSILEPGETMVFSCTSIPITQAEADAGEVPNTATASGTPAGGTLDPVDDDHIVEITPVPSFELVKDSDDVPVAAGETLDYTFTVTNDGNVTITDVRVSDLKCAAPAVLTSEDTPDGILDPGETMTFSCTSIPVTQAEVDGGLVMNQAQVDGTGPTGDPVLPTTDTVTIPIVTDPSFTLVKAATTVPTGAGDSVDYTFTVVNDGNVTIGDVTIADPKCASAPSLDSESLTADLILEPSETMTFVCTSIAVTQAEVDAGVVTNSATLTGTASGGNPLIPEIDDHEVRITSNPQWEMIKASASIPTGAGETIDYTFTIVNTGNVSISDVEVTDAKCAASPTLDSESIASDAVLQVGETMRFACTSIAITQAEVDAGQVDNTATATGTPAGGTLEDTTDDHSIPIVGNPQWEMVKASASVPTAAGDTIDYTFTIVNTGNITINNVALTDAKCAASPTLDSESLAADEILQVGETMTFVCTSIAITQAEVDSGEVLNTATAAGTPAGGSIDDLTDDVVVPVVAQPSWSLTKTTTSTPSAAGDTLDYSFLLTNTGNVTITSISASDAKCAAGPTLLGESIAIDAVLEPTESMTFACTSIAVSQAEVDAGQVDNTVSVSGTPAAGTLDDAIDEVSTPVIAEPSWEMVKASASVPTHAGDVLDYTFTIVNTGNVTINGVAVTDPKCATAAILDSESIASDSALEPGETMTFVCASIEVTQAEVDAGQVDNTATATGTPASGSLDEAVDGHSIPIQPGPAWAMVKTTASMPSHAGDTLEYTFTLINEGNVTIADVAIADPKCDTAPVTVSESVNTNSVLDPGETMILSCASIAVTQTEVDDGQVENVATATATPAGGALDDLTDDHVVVIPPQPSWSLTKTSSSAPSAAGETLDYAFDLTNTGNVTIGAITVADAKCNAGPTLDSESLATDGELEPGETMTYVCTSVEVTQAEVDAGEVLNTATAAGTPAGGSLADVTDSMSVRIIPLPALEMIKTSVSAPTTAGQTIDYTFTLVNTGNVTITSPVVSDPKCATTPTIDSESITADGILAVGEAITVSCTSVPATQAEVDVGEVLNTATATGNPAGGVLDPVEAIHEIPINPYPSWDLVKATASSPTRAGETLDYVFTVTNTGNVTIANVAITDSKCGATPTLESESLSADALLSPHETMEFSCTSVAVTQAEVDAGSVPNSAQVDGNDPAGTPVDPASDDHEVLVEAEPRLAIVKAAISALHEAGETIDYSFAVTNPGNVTIADVVVTDPKCASAPVLEAESIPDGVLEPGELMTFSCTSIPATQAEINLGQVDNTAEVGGNGPDGNPVDPAQGSTSVPIAQAPSWDLTKATDSSPTVAGDTLHYTFTVVNTGNVTISAVALTDPKCTSAPTLTSESLAPDTLLEVGETQIWECTSIPVTQTEVDAGLITNTAELTGTPAGGTLDLLSDTLVTDLAQNPSWHVTKSSPSVPHVAGDTVIYTFTVVNDGNVTIRITDVVDSKCAADPALTSESLNADTVLEVGETQIWTCTSIPATQAEIDAGEILNTVTLTGTPAGGSLDPVSDDHTILVAPTPALLFVKTSASAPTAAGHTLDYVFEATNSGNVTLHNVAVDDPKCAASPTLDSESITTDTVLEPGEAMLFSCTSVTVTQAEVDAGRVDNTARLTADLPNGAPLAPVEDSVSKPLPFNPGIAIVKNAVTPVGAVGDTPTYEFAVLNTGNVSISDVSVTDAKCAATPVLDSESVAADGVLIPGETMIYSCVSIPVTQTELDTELVENTATANGTPAGGTLTAAVDDHAMPIIAVPGFEIIKASASTPTHAGESLDYTFTVANTGNVTIGSAVVSDPKCSSSPTINTESVATDGVLQVGEIQSWSCTSIPVTQAEVDAGMIPNEATLAGTPVAGTLDDVSDDNIVYVPAQPSWNMTKSSASVPTAAGDTLDYTFAVLNTGNVSISAISATDAKCATSPSLDSESVTADTILVPGETMIWSCTSIPVTQAEVDAGQVDNTATVTGTPAAGFLEPAVGSLSKPIVARPDFEVVKASASAAVAAGDTLDYTFTVVSTGNVSISAVTVTDAKCATSPSLDSESITADAVLVPGETMIWSCTSIPISQAEVDAGAVLNVVNVTGTPRGGTLQDKTDDHTVAVVGDPAWELVKSSSSTPFQAGDTLDYTFTVVNTGNVSISDVAIADPKCQATPRIDAESVIADTVLSPGEAMTLSCASIAVTQSEVDAGQVPNTATVNGIPAGGDLAPDQDDHTVPVTPRPSWHVTKSTNSAPTTAGDTLEYRFDLSNTGNVTIGDISVSDAKCASTPSLISGDDNSDGDLDITEVWVLGCTSIPVTQAEVDAGQVVNVVTASGTPAGGTLEDTTATLRTQVDPNPEWTVIKSADSTVTAAGETIGYVFTVVNTGNVSISEVTATDPKCDAPPMVQSESVASDLILVAGEAMTLSCTSIPVTQAEIDAGEVINTVTLTGTPAGGILAPTGDDHVIIPASHPSFDLIKSSLDTVEAAGDTVEYSFTVVNTGSVTINQVVLSDPKCATTPVLDDESLVQDAVLQVGEGQIWSCTSVGVTQAEIDAGEVINTVTLTGEPAVGTLEQIRDSHVIPIAANPGFELVKATASTPAAADDSLDYAFTLVNTGNVTISNAGVSDAKCAATPTLVSETIAQDAILVPGESMRFECTSIPVTQDEANLGEVLNVATATGTPAAGSLDPVDDEHIVGIPTNPDIVLTKATTSVPTSVGDTLLYTFTVLNEGNVTIDNVTMIDPNCASAPILIDNPFAPAGAVVDPGESIVFTCTSIPVTQAEVDAGYVINSALVSGDSPIDVTVEDEDAIFVAIPSNPSFEVIKATASTPSQAGDTLAYTFTVINTGNVSLGDVTATDAKCDTAPTLDSESLADDQVLRPGETMVFSCTSIPVTQAEVDAGSINNTVSVDAIGPVGNPVGPVTDSHSIPVASGPSVEMLKAALSAPERAGDTIGYAFTVVNNGNVTLSQVAVTDPKCDSAASLQSESLAADLALAPGEIMIFACTSVPVTQTEVDSALVHNAATVNAIGPDGSAIDPATDEHNLLVPPMPEIGLVKVADNTPLVAGDTIDYEFTLTNIGNVSVRAIAVADPKCDGGPIYESGDSDLDAHLDLDETWTFSCTSVMVTQAEVDAGEVLNTATATGESPAGIPAPPAEATAITPVERMPRLELLKSVARVDDSNNSGIVDAGDTVSYEFVVTNVGNVVIDNIAVVDDLLGGEVCVIGSVAPTESDTCLATYVLTQADIDLGGVENAATATGDAPGGTHVSDISDSGTSTPDGNDGTGPDDPTWLTIGSSPQIELIKTAVAVAPSPLTAPGGTIEYTFEVANVGNVTLTEVAVLDPIISEVLCPDGAGVLAVGEAVTCTGTYVVTQSDIDAGGVENSATATATAPDGSVVADISDSGSDTIEGSDGSGDADPTWVQTLQRPSINVVKTLTSVIHNGDGTWNVGWSVVVSNTGTVTVNDVQVSDDLDVSFPAPAQVSVVDIVATDGGCVSNPNYGESGQSSLLEAGQTLEVGTSCRVDFTIELTPNTGNGTWHNSAVGTATSPSGSPVADVSDTGDETTETPDKDGMTNGDPTDDPAVVHLAESPRIGIAKFLDSYPVSIDPDQGTWEMTFGFVVENLGDVDLTDVQVDDDLTVAFAGHSPEVVDVAVRSGSCSINADYDGLSDTGLLAGSDELAPTQSCELTLTIRVVAPDGMSGHNQVSASGTSPAGASVTDLSVDGVDVDPDGDEIPTEQAPTPFVLAAARNDADLDNVIGSTVVVDPLVNDSVGVDLDPTSVLIWDPVEGVYTQSLVVDGEGSWTVDPITGEITFEPEPGFGGDPNPIKYSVQVAGSEFQIEATVTVTYRRATPNNPQPVSAPPVADEMPELARPEAEPFDEEVPTALAYTGQELAKMVSLAIALIGLGLGLVLATRRRF